MKLWQIGAERKYSLSQKDSVVGAKIVSVSRCARSSEHNSTHTVTGAIEEETTDVNGFRISQQLLGSTAYHILALQTL